MLLQKSRPFKGRLACSPLTKDVLIIFTAAEIKKIDMFPFTAQPQATEFAIQPNRSQYFLTILYFWEDGNHAAHNPRRWSHSRPCG